MAVEINDLLTLSFLPLKGSCIALFSWSCL